MKLQIFTDIHGFSLDKNGYILSFFYLCSSVKICGSKPSFRAFSSLFVAK